MTEQNWREYIPQDALEKTSKNMLPKRKFDNSFTSGDDLDIDGLYIKLRQRFGSTAFYFRKTQTGYRLYRATANGRSDILLFDETKCTEDFLYSLFISFDDKYTSTLANDEKDISLYRNEFLSIVSSAPDLFEGKYEGTKKYARIPISIYGDDCIEAVLWKNGKEILCADYPSIMNVYYALLAI